MIIYKYSGVEFVWIGWIAPQGLPRYLTGCIDGKDGGRDSDDCLAFNNLALASDQSLRRKNYGFIASRSATDLVSGHGDAAGVVQDDRIDGGFWREKIAADIRAGAEFQFKGVSGYWLLRVAAQAGQD